MQSSQRPHSKPAHLEWLGLRLKATFSCGSLYPVLALFMDPAAAPCRLENRVET